MRTIAIALDAADSELVLEWARDGTLPVLGDLIERGATARLSAETGLGPEATWPTMVTGCMPGKHGVYDWRCIRPGTDLRVRDPRRAYRRPFWSVLSDDGATRSPLLLDVPYGWADQVDGGTAVLGWGQRGTERTSSQPSHLLGELTERYGRYPLGLEVDHAGRIQAALEQLSTLQSLAGARTRLLIELLESRDWQVCVASYFESHYGGHDFHRYLVPGSWGYDERVAAELDEPLRRLYQTLDRCVGELLAGVGDDVNVVIFSGFGMRPNTNGLRCLPEALTRLGYTTPSTPSAPTRAVAGLRAAALTTVPRPLARWVRRRLPAGTQDRHFERVWHESADWRRTRAYAEGEPGHSFVRVSNSFSGDREALVDEVKGELQALENADTGRPAIAEVIEVRQATPGPNAGALPDLAIAWAQDGMLERVRHPKAGLIEEDLRELPPSEHTDEGFAIAAGPGIRAGDDIGGGHIVDLAPTLLHLAGAEIPTEMDGAPLAMLDPALGEPRLAEIDMEDDPWR